MMMRTLSTCELNAHKGRCADAAIGLTTFANHAELTLHRPNTVRSVSDIRLVTIVHTNMQSMSFLVSNYQH